MSANKVIVFGPTGGVGSVAALIAQRQGAKVYLAMRDTKKAIPGLTAEAEQKGGFERVQADLSDVASLRNAVTQTGATHAFVYLVFGATDGNKSIFDTLKSAGITFVVFLSSWGVELSGHGDATKVTANDNFISYAHAQAEINLERAFGPNGFVALRPASFATNSLRWKKMILEGHFRLAYLDADIDMIAPLDIGTVAGNLLAKGPQAAEGKKSITLCGPQLISYRDAAVQLAKALGIDLKVTELNEADGLKSLEENMGAPPQLAQALLSYTKLQVQNGADYTAFGYEESVNNIRKYAGKEPMTWPEWIAANKHLFSA